MKRLKLAIGQETPFVSVVIAVRNEEDHIRACLKSLTTQLYPKDKYEIIIVDDHSDDETNTIVQSFCTDKIKLFSLIDSNGISPKKAALHQGVQESRGEIILTTDADCRVPATWIQTMVKYFAPDTGAVASWLCVQENNHWLSKLETLDSLALSFVGAASFGWQRPMIANGANFAYRRQVYDELDGFSGAAEYGSGDDDLLLQKIHATQKWTCAFAPDPASIVVTHAQKNLSQFFQQRFRWASKSRLYPAYVVLVLGFLYFYLVSLLVSVFVFLFFSSEFSNLMLLLPHASKFLLDFAFMSTAARRLHKNINPAILFMTEWFQMLYITIVSVWGRWGTYTWKGRRYKAGRVSRNYSQQLFKG
ncbi:glycosyltransferase [candidate division KSB1 bacterium]|nr:glycosyltransferase [candidate division KSB1 bacterium]